MSREKWSDEKILEHLLRSKTDRAYWDNLRALRSRCNDDVFAIGRELARSDNKKKVIAGVEILAQLGAPERPYLKETLKIYFKIMKKEIDPEIISAVLYSIGHNNRALTAKEITILCNLKNATQLRIRQALTFALSGIENMKAVGVLIHLTKDKNKEVRDWATFGIGSQITLDNDVIRTALQNRISDKVQAVRHEAIMGLALRKDPAVKNIIEKELSSTNWHSSLLFETILVLHDLDFIPLLQQKLSEPKIEEKVNLDWIEHTIEKLKSS